MSDKVCAGAAEIETIRTTEVVGTVRSLEVLDRLAGELLAQGFDRSDIDLMGGRKEVLEKVNATYFDPAQIADVPDLPRREIVTRSDDVITSALLFGTLTAAGALIGLLASIGSWEGVLDGLFSAALGSFIGVGVALVLRKPLSPWRMLKKQLAKSSVAIFVRVRTKKDEQTAMEILIRNKCSSVHVHEVEISKRTPAETCGYSDGMQA